VTVYNAGLTKDAAKSAADKLTAQGFTSATREFPPNPTDPAQSTIYYSTEDQIRTADEIGRILDVGARELNPTVAAGNIVVVLR
jgi:ABC-type oligopeptide transport system substrate-binding subunit